MPLGLYKELNSNTFKRGNIAAFCLDKKMTKLGRDAGYLLSDLHCHPSVPLIKQIIAIPNDDVVLKENFILINGKMVNYKTYKTDSLNRPLPSIQRGHYQKIKGYWLIGTANPKSWDSRYWGMLNKNSMLIKLKPFIILR